MEETTAKRIKKALEVRQMPIQELSNFSGLSRSVIYKYMQNSNTPKESSLQKLADALHVSIDWLKGIDVPMEMEQLTGRYKAVPIYSLITSHGLAKQINTMIVEINKPYVGLQLNTNYFDGRYLKGDILFIDIDHTTLNGKDYVCWGNGNPALCAEPTGTVFGSIVGLKRTF